MKPEYQAWIDAFVRSHNYFVRGLCGEATKQMMKAFPELRRACGFAFWVCPTRLVRDEHFWCVTPDGTIVDPTVSQFGGAPVRYEELDLNKPEDVARLPTGKCMWCGGDCYNGRTSACSDECEEALNADIREWEWERNR